MVIVSIVQNGWSVLFDDHEEAISLNFYFYFMKHHEFLVSFSEKLQFKITNKGECH